MELVLTACAVVTLFILVTKAIIKMGQLIERIDMLVAKSETETVQRRAADQELHERIDGLYTPRPGRLHG